MVAEYKVRLVFSSDLCDEEKNAIVKNILDSLIHTANTAGLVPDNAGGFTEMIGVTRPATGVTLAYDLLSNNEIKVM